MAKDSHLYRSGGGVEDLFEDQNTKATNSLNHRAAVASSWQVPTNTGFGEDMPVPKMVRTDAAGSSSTCIYTHTRATLGGEWVANEPIRSPGAHTYRGQIPTLESDLTFFTNMYASTKL